jgi:alpha-tubulin suppressor-like RCC1 family protein
MLFFLAAGTSLYALDAPPNFRTQDRSSNSITWAWDNVSGEEGYQILDNSTGLVIIDDIDPDATYTLETGLAENTQYNRQVRAFSNSKTVFSGNSNLISAYTLVEDPLDIEFDINAISPTSACMSVVAPPNSISGLTGSNFELVGGTSGEVYGWGYNGYGQIGDGTTATRSTPVQTPGIEDAVRIGRGSSHTLAVLSNGSVLAWGYNGQGQLGDGTTSHRYTPIIVPGITNAVEVAGGGDHSAAVLSNGSVLCWGSNSLGQCGDGTTIQRNSPVLVPGINNAVKIGTGGSHTHAVLSNGSVLSWGWNGSGCLGDGTATQRENPVQVLNITNAISVDGGVAFTIAVLSNGSIAGWGSNSDGCLGDGTGSGSYTAVLASGITNAVDVGAGWYHSQAVLDNGMVVGFGRNTSGRLGDGTTTNRLSPVPVVGITNGIEVSSRGGDIFTTHTLATLSNGSVAAWGSNNQSQIGDGTTTYRQTPVIVQDLSGAISAVAGRSHSIALVITGSSGWLEGQYTYTATDLSPNSTYTYRVRLRNGDGVETAWTGNKSVITPCALPASLFFSNVTAIGMELNWSANDNPAWTTYHIEMSLDNSAFSPVSVTTSLSYSNNSLDDETSYYFRIRAENLENQYTEWVYAAESTLSLPPPSSFGVKSRASTSFTWKWGDIIGEEGYQIFDNISGSLKIDNIAADTTYTTETGLSPNTSYSRTVRSYRDSKTTFSDNSSVASPYTLTGQATGFSFTGCSSNSVSMQCDAPPNAYDCQTAVMFEYIPDSSPIESTDKFESGFGNWTNTSGDQFDWTRHSGTTTSSGTGPNGAAEGTYYIYTESSLPNFPANTAYILFNSSDCTPAGEFDLVVGSISFNCHMCGVAMGTLALEIWTGSSWDCAWSRTGNQGSSWFYNVVDLNSYVGANRKMRFRGLTGTSFTSDMCLDNITVMINSGGGAESSDWLTANSYADSGLIPNTTYQYRAVWRNGDGIEDTPGPTYAAFTAPGIPGMTNSALTFTGQNETSITIAVNLNGNPEGTEIFLFYAEGTATQPTGSFLSAGVKTSGYTWIIGGLTIDTSYWFKAAARGISGAWSSNCAITAWSTDLISQPIGLAGSGNTTTSIQWSWTDRSGVEEGYQVLDNATDIVIVDDIATDSTFTIETGLLVNTLYNRKVRAFKSSKTEFSDNSNAASAYTLVGQATGFSFTGYGTTSIEMQCDPPPNAYVGSTAIRFQFVSGGSGGTNSGWLTTNTYTDNGLVPNTTYEYRALWRNGNGTEGIPGVSADTCTAAAVPAMFNSSATFPSCTNNSITVTPGLNSNPSGTPIVLFSAKGDENGPTESFVSRGMKITGYSWNVSELEPYTYYWFKASGRNWTGVWSDNSAITFCLTGYGTPANFRCTDCSSTSLLWEWDNFGGDGFHIYDNDTDAIIISDIASDATFTMETGLSPNTSYRRYIKAFATGNSFHYYAECQSTVSNFSTVNWTNACILEGVFEAGTYLVIGTAQIRDTDTTSAARCRMMYNESLQINESYYDVGTYFHSFMSSKVFSANGTSSYSFTIQIKEGIPTPVQAQNAAIIAIKFPTANYNVAENPSQFSTTSTTPVLHTWLTVTESTASDYLVVYTNNHWVNTTTDYQSRSQVYIPGSSSVYSMSWRSTGGSLANARYIHSGFWPLTDISSNVDVNQYYYSESVTYTSYMLNVHSAAFRLNDPIWNGYACNTYIGSKSTTTSDSLVTLAFTPSEAKDYLIMASCQLGQSSSGSSNRVQAWLEHNGIGYDSMEFYTGYTTGQATFAGMRRIYLNTSPQTFQLGFARPVSGTAYAANGSLIALPLSGDEFTDPSNTVEACTLASVPYMANTAVTFTQQNATCITIKPGLNGNPPFTVFELFYAAGDEIGPTEAFTSAGTTSGPTQDSYEWQVGSLPPDSYYWFKACAKNWAGIWTGNCAVTVWKTDEHLLFVNGTTGSDSYPGTEGQPVKTIQKGLDLALSSDSIVYVADGTYTGTGNRDMSFAGKALHLMSENGPASCIIDCENFSRAFRFQSSETHEAVVQGFTIRNGKSSATGGAIVCSSSSTPTIRCCIIENCNASNGGGGAIYANSASPIVENCLLRNNVSSMGGGALAFVSSTPSVISCTIANNSATGDGGAIWTSVTDIDVKNTIIWGNIAGGMGNQIYQLTNTLSLYYSCYSNSAGDIAGSGTVSPDANCRTDNPLFVDQTGGDFHLQYSSPCIDSGCNSYIPPFGNIYDLDDNPRILNGIIDMGSYETTPAPGMPDNLLVSGKTNPASLGCSNIFFSAIHYGEGEGAAADDAWIIVDNDPAFLSPEWNSTWIVLNPSTAPGTRCMNIPYAGAPLSPGVSYYWKLKFNNKNDQEGPYSNENASFKKAQFTVNLENAGWHLLPIPCYTGMQTVQELLGDDLGILWIWHYSEAARAWVQLGANETFQNGVGYFVWCKYPGEVAGFNGTPISGGTDPVLLSWTNTGSFGNDGWNLVRHPYPSALSWFGDTSLQNCETTHWYPWNGDEYLLSDKATGGCG